MSNEQTPSKATAASAQQMENFVADAAGGDYKAVAAFLEKHREDIDRRNEEGWSALRWAARYGHHRVVKLLIETGATIDLNDRDIMTALLYAARYGHTDVARILLENKADVNRKNKAGWTSLMWAVRSGHKEMTMLLLGVDGLMLDEKNEDGSTALMLAVWNRQYELIEPLLRAGASLTEKDNTGMTALALAQSADDADAVQLLEQWEKKRANNPPS